MKKHARGRRWWWWWKGGMAQNHFSVSIPFFKLQFKNTSNLILLGFKMSSESFFHKNFKTGLIFWHMWFFKFQNLVRTCKHIGGTPCMLWTANIYFFKFQMRMRMINLPLLSPLHSKKPHKVLPKFSERIPILTILIPNSLRRVFQPRIPIPRPHFHLSRQKIMRN